MCYIIFVTQALPIYLILQMAPPKQPRGHTPFKDITNTTRSRTGLQTLCSVHGSTTSEQPPSIDPRERKRQQDRERYAQMPEHKKQALLNKRREDYHKKKAAATVISQLQPQIHNGSGGHMGSIQSMLPRVTNMASGKGNFSTQNTAFHPSLTDACSDDSYIPFFLR